MAESKPDATGVIWAKSGSGHYDIALMGIGGVWDVWMIGHDSRGRMFHVPRTAACFTSPIEGEAEKNARGYANMLWRNY